MTKPKPAWSWKASIAEAKAAGGKEIRPNGLPIKCIRHDGTMLEHEDGDHVDYKFPVEIEFIGKIYNNAATRKEDMMLYGRVLTKEEARRNERQTHALIYTDGSLVVTLYESSYAFWYLKTGECAGGHLWKREWNWRLSDKSRRYIIRNLRKARGLKP